MRYIAAVQSGTLCILEVHAETRRQRAAEYKLCKLQYGSHKKQVVSFDDLKHKADRVAHRIASFADLPVQASPAVEFSMGDDDVYKVQQTQAEVFGVKRFSCRKPRVLQK